MDVKQEESSDSIKKLKIDLFYFKDSIETIEWLIEQKSFDRLPSCLFGLKDTYKKVKKDILKFEIPK